ncbi:thiamine ABC transporter substrate binding subunit [Micrococcus sp.]|uniref:thiamine ABC transporter substrate-binding protein n=1 Tax=Micrococcus sp. TaxID=1271 RepID=UPI002A90B3B0|nr:thiamine ABC transporter substrate-binding protein [Micrococcus sp.]MDY6054860.1 thiamine ABC transporter substrate-binding protein [Micrococcus sp.]
MSHPRIRRSRRAAFVALSAAALALTGCSVTAPGGTDSPSAPGASGAPAGEASTVRIMTHDSFTLPPELLERFERESGYRLVTTAPGDSGTVVNQILLAKDAPTVDGVYGVEDHSAHRLVREGAVAEHTPENLPASAAELMVDGRMTPVDQGQVCFTTDPAWFQAHGVPAPTSIDQLDEPPYAELTVVTSPLTSSPGMSLLAATTQKYGQDGWQGWWRGLLENGGKVGAGWSDAYEVDFSGGQGRGAFPIVLSYVSSPAFAPQTTVIEDSCTPQVEYAGVLEGAQNPEGARAFVDFLLTEEVQAALPEAMYMYPVDETIPLPQEWAEHAPLVADPITPDPARVDEQRENLLKEWTALSEEVQG